MGSPVDHPYSTFCRAYSGECTRPTMGEFLGLPPVLHEGILQHPAPQIPSPRTFCRAYSGECTRPTMGEFLGLPPFLHEGLLQRNVSRLRDLDVRTRNLTLQNASHKISAPDRCQFLPHVYPSRESYTKYCGVFRQCVNY
jgi:hypothetical protein